MSNSWQHRKADTLEERLGLLDKPTGLKYRNTPVFQEPQGELPKRELTAFGITSGIGSMLYGASQMGFRVVGNIEWRDYYRYRRPGTPDSTFLKNFPGAFIARGLDDVPRDLLPPRIDFAAGHPECGMYSVLRTLHPDAAAKHSPETDASDLPLFLKYVAALQPRFFLMDDLPGSFKALPMQAYVDLLPDYDLFPEWISNWGYGNIQKHRNRMFIVGARKDERFTFIPGERPHTQVLGDILADLLTVEPGAFANHQDVDPARIPGRFVNLRYLGDRPTWADFKQWYEEDPEANHKSKPYVRKDGEHGRRPGTTDPKWGGACPVLSGGYAPIHPLKAQPLTVRERARIQGFPDSFVFDHSPDGPFAEYWEPYDTNGQRGVKQTGKAMPLQFCTYVAEQVKAHIHGDIFPTTGERIIKPNVLVSEAKKEFCRIAGYADQESACRMCWMKDACEIRRERSNRSGLMEVINA